MIIGYVRCSTEEQNEARQIEMMEEHKVERFFTDKRSGKNTDRKEFKEMMSFVREGDTYQGSTQYRGAAGGEERQIRFPKRKHRHFYCRGKISSNCIRGSCSIGA